MREARADAPGRVNLIGEHTDYHDGFVLPCAVPQRTYVTVRPTNGLHVRAVSDERPGVEEFTLGEEQRANTWGDYVRGVTWALAEAGARVSGFTLHLRSTVPVGSGLSSSAALEIALLRALRTSFDLSLSDVELARIGQRAEVGFVGAPVGIMDQMAVSLAGEQEALFLDTRTLAFERIPLPHSLDLVVIDSGVRHQHAGGEYVTRRRESEEAARLLGVTRLREVSTADLARIEKLPPTLARRARHVVTENERVLAARDALREGDLPRLGRLFGASHASMRDDYEITVPPIDLLVELASACHGVFGARMTGGGFGGSIVVAAAAGGGAAIAAQVTQEYVARSNRSPAVLLPLAS